MRLQGGYDVEFEPGSGTTLFNRYQTLHLQEGRRVVVYSAVFAPTALNTNIVHHWQHYDEAKEKWVTVTHATFPIVGGRDGGYRGYSWKLNVESGYWRVNVETPNGQLLGRIKFKIEMVSEDPKVERKTI